ncbi:SRPBCC family protein [Zeaxanthinibacter sp. PT1]|uniref:SRPBCC family protein n=1 Tax=Zeaxanthinibacter TaxID=561554 RepID=UPI002349A2E1|nr:SRPBCC family protein [Zeaxanthinibacter sp. PT1]MDC6350976.1 SRPBCC family protein [Zeaxanthinibacter sp. PT1]
MEADTTPGRTEITISTTIRCPIAKVWQFWTQPNHITRWNFASDEWHCPSAVNDLRPGGTLDWRMEAKDGSMGFDYTGTYDEIRPKEIISYQIADGRKVTINFQSVGSETRVKETFEMDNTHPEDIQRNGWQSILDNFKKYAESASEKTN